MADGQQTQDRSGDATQLRFSVKPWKPAIN
jgi:hypothetical protein